MEEKKSETKNPVQVLKGESAADLPHFSDFCELFWLRSGKADYETGGKYYSLKKGSIILLSPEETHRLYLYGEGQDFVCVLFEKSYLDEISSEETKLSDCFLLPVESEKRQTVLSSEEQSNGLWRKVTELSDNLTSTKFGSDLLVRSSVAELILYAVQIVKEEKNPEKAMPQLVRQTIRYVEEHISEPIQIGTMSKELYHNRSHVSRMFREYVGIPLQQYIINQRLNLVMQKIQEGKSLVEASEAAGFGNYSNFIRTFTKHVGVSPHDYKKQLEEQNY